MSVPALLLAAVAAVGFPFTTQDSSARALMDKGLLFAYAYDGADAAGTFQSAASRDPKLAMALWGEALANGPDLNTPMAEERFARGKAAVQQAVALERGASPRERRFIDAMALRFTGTWSDWQANSASYRQAMIALAADPVDAREGNVAAVLAAEALLENGGLTWTGTSPATAEARQALSLIDRVLAADPNNLMANHLCIHVYDLAFNRAPARVCAQRLDATALPPQAEHLAHMPAHFWIETGDYAAAVASSERAYQLFMQLQSVRERDPDHDRYLSHDVYVGYSAAMMLDDYADAKTWAKRMAAAYETSYDALTALRFGKFADAYALARDDSPNSLAVRGLAALGLGNDAAAHSIADRLHAQTTYGDIVQIFFASLAQREGHSGEAIRWIERAVETQRNSFAAELIPLLPALEFRGALAMQRAAYADAASAYRAALAAFPNDPRAVSGLAAAQRALHGAP